MTAIPIVHAITTDDIVADPAFASRAAALLRAVGARGAVHVRAPGLAARALLAVVRELAPLQEETGGWVVVNDRVDVAAAGGARAVQLTSRSLRADDAARVAPGLARGASVHAPEEAWEAARARVDWVVAGHVFETASHPGAPGRGTTLLASLAALPVPVIAIGGVRPADVPALRRAGASGVAAIRGIWGAPGAPSDAAAAALDYLSWHDAHDAA